MAEALSKTLTHGDFDSVFQEVQQPETVSWTTEGELRLFHLVIRNNKINVEDLKAYLYMSMGDYVFSRAKLEKFSQAGNRDAVVSQALRVIKKNGGADVQGTGGELGEVLNYTFMEEKLHAPKLMSRVEISTDGKQYDSIADSIHLLTSGVSGRPYHQVVFGSSNIVGDLGYAIDGAFEKICRIEQHEVQEIHMANQLIFERMATDEEAALVKDIQVDYFPGGADNLKVHTIFTYAKTHITNRFIIFDGDQKPTTEIPDFSEVLEKDKTLIYYKDVLREVVGVKADSIAWGMDANSKSGRKNEDQEKTLLVEYLEFFRDNVRFLPKLIPEDLIFNSDKLQAICGDLPPVDSIDDSKAKLKAVADSTGYDFGNLISILTTSFIKTKNEDYQYILALLKSIIER